MQSYTNSFVLAGILMTAPSGFSADVEKVKILAQGDWQLPVHTAGAQGRERQQLVISSEKELAKIAGPHALAAVRHSLKVDAIDFEKQMLLAVSDGTLPTVGVSGGGPPSVPYRIEIVRVLVIDEGKTMLVFWRHAQRDEKEGVITHPLAIVMVDRFPGNVKFERLPTRVGMPVIDEKLGVGKEIKILARAFWPDGWRVEMPAQEWIIRSRDELIDPRLKAPEHILERMRQENADRYAKALKVETIDFEKQMIIGVSAGVQSGPGVRVELVRVDKDAKTNRLTVHWKLTDPKQVKADNALAHPAAVALVEQFPGKVTFVEEGR